MKRAGNQMRAPYVIMAVLLVSGCMTGEAEIDRPTIIETGDEISESGDDGVPDEESGADEDSALPGQETENGGIFEADPPVVEATADTDQPDDAAMDDCQPLPDPPGDVIVDLADEGLREGELIDPYLDEHLADGVQLHIPAGTYRWEGAGDGSFDDASIVGDGEVVWDAGDGWEFGTSWRTDTNFELRNITVRGRAGNGSSQKLRFAATSPGGVMTVRNLHLPDGAEGGGEGRTAIRVGANHAGDVYFIDLRVTGFPDNALYACNPGEPGGEGGAVHVVGGYFHNNNITGVRIGSDNSSIIGTVIVNDGDAPTTNGSRNQRGIRIREEGLNIRIEDVDIVQTVSGTPIEIDDKAGLPSGMIRNVRIRNETSAAPIRNEGDGEWSGEGIHVTGDGDLEPSGPGDFEVCSGAGCDAPDLEPWPTCR